jgi:hypothetical protein
VATVPLTAFTLAVDVESTCESAEAEPVPVELAATAALAADFAVALPSVLLAAPLVLPAAFPDITPPPMVETSTLASAEDEEVALLASDDVVLPAIAVAAPWASPLPVEVPLTAAEAVESPSSVDEFAVADPAAEAPVPAVTKSTPAFTVPSVAKEALVSASAVEVSVVS